MSTSVNSLVCRCHCRCLQENATVHPELLIMLLCNVTTTEQGSERLLQIGRGDLEGFHM